MPKSAKTRKLSVICLIAFIGVFVPRRLRADWRQEWEAELRYRESLLSRWDNLNWRNKLDLLWHSLGAFADALWLQPRRMEDEMFQDLRFGLRMLAKNPGFTLIAIFTLALGIGANAAIFNLINAVLLKPLSGREPERLVGLYSRDTTRVGDYRLFSYPNYGDLRAEQSVFDDILATNPFNAGVTEGDITRQVGAVKISSNYFLVFGVQLAQGRSFLFSEETRPAPVAIVSYRWWRQRGAAPDLVGQSIRVNSRLLTIVGIAPQGFTGANAFFSPDIFLPLSFEQLGGGAAPLQDRNRHDLTLVGRLKRGLTLEEANTRLKTVSAQLAEAYPGANRDQLITVARLPRMAISSAPRDDRAQIATVSALALSLSCLVLLIVCLNLANMLLARGAARRKELAVRLALGARAGRLVRQLLTEGFLLATLGGVAGLALATLATRWLADSMTEIAPTPLNLDARPDLRALGATLGFSALATIFFALGPALKAVRFDVNSSLKGGAGVDARSSRSRLLAPRRLLVIGQVAFSLCLLVAAGLAGRGAFQAIHIDPGFDLDRGFYLQLDSGLVDYDEARTRQLYWRLAERVRSLPGVEAVSLALTPPFGLFTWGQRVQTGGAPYPPPDAATPAQGKPVAAHYNVIGPDFFRTLGIPLLQGREFRHADSTEAPREAIISSTLAEKLWPGEEALGRTIQLAGGSDADDPGVGAFIPAEGKPRQTFEVVGVAPPFRDQLLPLGDHPLVFVPFGQDYRAEMSLLVRAAPAASVDALLREAREEARRVDPWRQCWR